MISNCFLWSFRRYATLIVAWLRAGRPVQRPVWGIEPSRVDPWWMTHWHVLHWDGEHWVREEFRPLEPMAVKWYMAWAHLLFRGRVEVTTDETRPAPLGNLNESS